MLDAEQLVNIEFSARNGPRDLIHHRLVRSPSVPFVNHFGQEDSELGKGPLLSELMCRLRVDEDSVHVKDDRCDLRICYQRRVRRVLGLSFLSNHLSEMRLATLSTLARKSAPCSDV